MISPLRHNVYTVPLQALPLKKPFGEDIFVKTLHFGALPQGYRSQMYAPSSVDRQSEEQAYALMIDTFGLHSQTRRFNSKWFHQLLGVRHLFVIRRPSDARIVAMALMEPSLFDKKSVLIGSVCVHVDEQGKRLSSELLDEISKLAKQIKRSRLLLDVETNNGPAKRVYRDYGFIPTHAETLPGQETWAREL